MENYIIRKYSKKDFIAWNDFINQAKNATFLFHRDFMEYHQDRFEDHSLLVFEKEKLVAVLPANIAGNVLHSHQGLTYGGLVYSDKLKLEKILKIFKAVLQFLHENGIATLYLKILPHIYTASPSEELEYILFLTEAELIRRDSMAVIQMNNPVRLDKGRKEGVAKGVKNQLNVKETTGFESFWNEILVPNLQKKHGAKPVHSLEEITGLQAKFPQNIRQFNVYSGEQLVAGTTVFETPEVAHLQYISGNETKNESGSLDFLHHYLLTSVFHNKNYFDFGISNENQGKNINQGLSFWKESFGARTIVQNFYKVNTTNFSNLDNVLI